MRFIYLERQKGRHLNILHLEQRTCGVSTMREANDEESRSGLLFYAMIRLEDDDGHGFDACALSKFNERCH